MAHDVFISYSSHDTTVADAARAALEAQQIRCWIAPRDVLAGTEFGEAIVNAISNCRIFALIFSGHADKSPHVRREVERAVSKGKIIIPFRIEDILPTNAMEYGLSNTQWFDARTPPPETHFAALSETILRLLNGRDGPARRALDSTPATSLFLFGYYAVQCLLSPLLPSEQRQRLYSAMRELPGIPAVWVNSVLDAEQSFMGLCTTLQFLGADDTSRSGQLVWLGAFIKILDNSLSRADQLPEKHVKQSRMQCNEILLKLDAPRELLEAFDQCTAGGQIDEVVGSVLRWLARP